MNVCVYLIYIVHSLENPQNLGKKFLESVLTEKFIIISGYSILEMCNKCIFPPLAENVNYVVV
jgi:hypothetical protein